MSEPQPASSKDALLQLPYWRRSYEIVVSANVAFLPLLLIFQQWFLLATLVALDGCFAAYRLHQRIQRSLEIAEQQAEDLADQQARLRTIFDTAADGIITMNHHGVVEDCNQAALDVFGLTREKFLKKPIFAFLEEVQENADATDDLCLKLLDINSAIGKMQEYSGTRGDGQKFYVEFAVAEARINERRIITGILHDVTVRRGLEVELKRAHANASAATEAKTQFLANMSHEIRTPMTAIIGYADLLLEPGQSNDERTRCVETIRRNADHLLTLINDILDISKIEAGKMTVEFIRYSPSQVVSDVASLMRVRALEKKIHFEVAYDSPIPAEITGDPVRMRQILINLVGNAIKFTKVGQVKIHVWSDELDGPNPQIYFKVVDSGIGMTSEQLTRLFRPFTQADDSTTRQFGGTGLGLTICKRLIEMMKGSIDVKTMIGLGSSFECRVPTGNLTGVRILANAAEAEVESFSDNKHVHNIRLHARILLADDGVDNRRLISYHLQKAGATVVQAENGKQAFDKAVEAFERGQPFDVVFMDMAMPVMDGYQATSRLRQYGYQRPIIALTAHAMSGDRDKCVSAGCDDYLTKPIDARKLIEMARSASEQAAATNSEPPTATTTTVTAELCASVDESIDDPSDVLVSSFAHDAEMSEIIELFVGGLDDRINSMDRAFEENNLPDLANTAHQLKGAAGGYGYPLISQLAMDVERLARVGEINDELRSTLDRLVLMCRRAIAGAQQLQMN